jgi:predicted RNA-binding Zn-ribbon protein involved in translation (DUF1610 family)
MARSRRTTTSSSPAATNAREFKCPECGKTFSRAASLGAHRNRAHGVIGASKRRTRSKSASPSASTKGARGRRRSSAAASRATRSRRQDGQPTLNRDQLLQTLFPNGVPAREDVIRRVGSWLDEAEQLAKL